MSKIYLKEGQTIQINHIYNAVIGAVKNGSPSLRNMSEGEPVRTFRDGRGIVFPVDMDDKGYYYIDDGILKYHLAHPNDR